MLNAANRRIAYRFHARDLHLTIGPAARATSVRRHVLIDCSRGAMRWRLVAPARVQARMQLNWSESAGTCSILVHNPSVPRQWSSPERFAEVEELACRPPNLSSDALSITPGTA